MKLKVPKIFNTDKMNDQQILFCWFLGKFFNRYGWDQHFTIDSFDAKIIIRGNVKTPLHPAALRPFAETIDVAFYTERRIGIQLTPAQLQQAKKKNMYGGRIAIGDNDVEIKSKTAILLYSYLLGILGVMDEWTYESKSPTGLKPEELEDTSTSKDGRITSGFELQQLLDALD